MSETPGNAPLEDFPIGLRFENNPVMEVRPASEIESQFARLSPEAQVRLLERLVHRLRLAVVGGQNNWEAELSAMAADPQIKHELIQTNAEFSATEADGLERQ
jgi:hypothetical protein